jgi:polyhydroxybutyrate depolymerase
MVRVMSAPSLAVASALALLAWGCDSPAAGPDAGVPDAGGPPLVYGGDRPVELQLPDGLTDGETYPLVLVLHGYGNTGFIQQAYLGLGLLRADPRAFVLAPDGTTDADGNQFWNASGACCDFGGTGVDDVAYLGGLLDDVLADWPIDRSRVVVVGHSNGGFMAHRLACARADVVTGIADLAGADVSVDGSDCAPSAAVNVLHLHGTADAVVSYGGGVLVADPYPGAVATIDHWATRNGCAGEPTVGDGIDLTVDVDGAETVPATQVGCAAGGATALWSIEEGSHIPSLSNEFAPAVIGWLMDHPRPQ